MHRTNKILIIFIIYSCVLCIPKPNSFSIGMSESLGVFGMLNANYTLNGWSNDLNKYSITVGGFLIPVFGGFGLNYKRYFNISRKAPFVSLTAFSSYMIPVMCENCKGIKLKPFLSGCLGIDFDVIKIMQRNINIQIGIMSLYDIVEGGIFKSPSDKPGIWPVANIKLSGKF